MIPTDKSNPGAGMPGIGVAAAAQIGIDLTKYKVRVGRYVIDENTEDLLMFESILHRGMNPKDTSVIIFDRKENFNEGVYTSLLFYYEKNPE